jgi:Putative polyhydroxyalkanoic acid system protein (PHA_gran_rgn)
MSAPLVVSIPHRLGREEAAKRLKGGLSRAAASVPVLSVDEERWEGDRMFFRVRALGQAASGQIDVADDHVRLEVVLPWLCSVLPRWRRPRSASVANCCSPRRADCGASFAPQPVKNLIGRAASVCW